ncbi:MAG: penicillin-binding transpeptidase domain-containing protein, partial [Oscillospiraceae bacterium]|nr:penicillin-binding transpeptidase domain-containing protein [Oscillospiraceae bacterium]
SSIKPVSVYAPAIDQGIINWGTPMEDEPSMILNNKWWPTNYPAGNEGLISLSRAIAVSKNTIAVRVLQELTPEASFRFLTDQLGISSLVEEMTMGGKVYTDIAYAPLALGGLTKGVSVYELTAAYSMFVNEGIYTKPRSYTLVTDQNDNVILDNMPKQKIVIEPETAWIMTKLLKGVVEDGTAKGLRMKNKIEVAGKTGTTNEEYDRWFIGYTPYYLCGCWFGYDTPKYMNVPAGDGNPPMLLFNYVMDKIHEPVYENPKTFPELPTIIEARYCKRSGMAPGPDCDWTDMGYYSKKTAPSEMCDFCQPEEEEEEEEETTEQETTEQETTEQETTEKESTTEPATKPPETETTEEPTVAQEEPTSDETEPENTEITESTEITENLDHLVEEPTLGDEVQ